MVASDTKTGPKRRGRPKTVGTGSPGASPPGDRDASQRVARLTEVVPRIERRLDVIGIAEAPAALAAGLSKDGIRNMRRKIAKGGRRVYDWTVNMSTLEALAPVLRTTPQWLAWGIGREEVATAGRQPYSDGPERGDEAVGAMDVLGEIAAGAMLNISIYPPEVPIGTIHAPTSERFPNVRHYALRVRGDSVNQIYPDKSYVICIDFAESGLRLTSGQIAHVERRRYGGQEYEITLKEVRIGSDGVVTLHPRSTNPAYEPLRLDDLGDDTEVYVRGIVVSGITPAPVV